MAGHTEGPSAKMPRTADHLVNHPQTNAYATPNSNNTAEVDALKARNEELLSMNKELLDMLKTNMAMAKADLAAQRVELQNNRDFGAKIQGEISSLKRPRRQTTLRREVEESQERINELEEELHNTKAENAQLRGDMENLRQDRDLWKSLFEQNQKTNNEIQSFDMAHQPNVHPTPPPSFYTGACGFNPPQTFGNMDYIQPVTRQPQQASVAAGRFSQEIPATPFMYQPQEANVAAGSSSSHISAAPVYRSPDSTGENVAPPRVELSPDSLQNIPAASQQQQTWEPDFNLDANDLNIDIDAFLANVLGQGASSN